MKILEKYTCIINIKKAFLDNLIRQLVLSNLSHLLLNFILLSMI